jgi:excinuclease ABC subunit C
MFLEGKNEALIGNLRRRMEEEAERLNFEAAAKIRDQIAHIERVVEKQKIVSTDFIDQDVIGLHRQDHTTVVHPLFIRAGKLLGGRGFTFPSVAFPEEEVLASFLHQYYREGKFIPDQILLPASIPDQELMEEWFTELKGKRVRILIPERGEKKHLVDMACENAEKFLRAEAEVERDRETLLELLKEELHLTRLPRRIEAFDMSNIQGRHAVGSMIVFEDGKPANERYRHFKIKSIEGADDYGMMYEVLLRRYKRALEENDLPDLVLVDGGKGQLNIAQEVFKELHIRSVDLVSLAKERPVEGSRSRKPGRFGEKVYHPQFKEPLILGRHSSLLHLLVRVRDEAHRFAITYHKKVRSKGTIKSALGDIPGIGRMRQRALLKHFGSLEKIREATLEELAGAPKMNSKAAQKVYEFFHPDK